MEKGFDPDSVGIWSKANITARRNYSISPFDLAFDVHLTPTNYIT
ncbi:hypothetical protein [Marinomonas colpomeniae]|nr:hypothetical protein [Marinomonas colpomeniae]